MESAIDPLMLHNQATFTVINFIIDYIFTNAELTELVQ